MCYKVNQIHNQPDYHRKNSDDHEAEMVNEFKHFRWFSFLSVWLIVSA